MEHPPRDPDGPLPSLFAHDPEMKGLVEFFLGELTKRVEAVRNAMADKDLDELRTLAHQLRGAAGGYGYPTVGLAAAAVEQALVQGMCDEAGLASKVNELLELCERAAKPSH